MKALLPADASDVYYKDLVGNISTSHFRKEKKQSVLEIQPRFPLYGGWKFTWFYGYTIPQAPFLVPTGKPEEYTLKVSFVPTIANFLVDKSVLKVILPEGAEYELFSY